MSTVPHKWWCHSCQRVVEPSEVTFEETHDIRVDGCGAVVLAVGVGAKFPSGAPFITGAGGERDKYGRPKYYYICDANGSDVFTPYRRVDHGNAETPVDWNRHFRDIYAEIEKRDMVIATLVSNLSAGTAPEAAVNWWNTEGKPALEGPLMFEIGSHDVLGEAETLKFRGRWYDRRETVEALMQLLAEARAH